MNPLAHIINSVRSKSWLFFLLNINCRKVTQATKGHTTVNTVHRLILSSPGSICHYKNKAHLLYQCTNTHTHTLKSTLLYKLLYKPKSAKVLASMYDTIKLNIYIYIVETSKSENPHIQILTWNPSLSSTKCKCYHNKTTTH